MLFLKELSNQDGRSEREAVSHEAPVLGPVNRPVCEATRNPYQWSLETPQDAVDQSSDRNWRDDLEFPYGRPMTLGIYCS